MQHRINGKVTAPKIGAGNIDLAQKRQGRGQQGANGAQKTPGCAVSDNTIPTPFTQQFIEIIVQVIIGRLKGRISLKRPNNNNP